MDLDHQLTDLLDDDENIAFRCIIHLISQNPITRNHGLIYIGNNFHLMVIFINLNINVNADFMKMHGSFYYSSQIFSF